MTNAAYQYYCLGEWVDVPTELEAQRQAVQSSATCGHIPIYRLLQPCGDTYTATVFRWQPAVPEYVSR